MSAAGATKRREEVRQAASLDALNKAIAEPIDVPPPVTDVKADYRGIKPLLSAEAFERARQVYYLEYGNIADAARTLIAEGLTDVNETRTRERLKNWWNRQGWPKRSHQAMVALRDASSDGGLHRGERLCKGVATGSGPAPKGQACTHTVLNDSEYCYFHDPRPEYVAKRQKSVEALVKGRLADMVPLEPFKRFMAEQANICVEEARAQGESVHPNTTEGWSRLADKIGIRFDTLHRIAVADSKRGKPRTQIRAKTVARYIAPLGVEFEEVYGFPRPEVGFAKAEVCPDCGGKKEHNSVRCIDCSIKARGDQCLYVNGRGRRCPTLTKHPSGYCAQCQQIVFREKKSTKGRQYLPDEFFLYALDVYRREDAPKRALFHVARMMWAYDVAGVHDTYRGVKQLASTLAKQFRKYGWKSREDVEGRYRELVDKLGEPKWPDREVLMPIEGMLPFDPFLDWILEAADRMGLDTTGKRGWRKKLAERLSLDPERLSQWIRGEVRGSPAGTKSYVQVKTVERALASWNEATGENVTMADVFGADPWREP